MTFKEAKEKLASKLGIRLESLSNNGIFTEDDLESYINTGALKAWDFAQWDFAERSKKLTLTSDDIDKGYIPYPEDISPLSIHLLKINGKEYDKVRFKDYEKFFEDYPNKESRFWTEHNRIIFFNKNSASAGQQLDLYGKEMYEELQTDNDPLPFSPEIKSRGTSGNHAIILLAYAEALSSEKKKNPRQGEKEEQKAYTILSAIENQASLGRIIERSENRPQFNVPNFFDDGIGSSSSGTFRNFNN